MPIRLRVAPLVLVATMIGIDATQAADVKVMAANAVKEPFLEPWRPSKSSGPGSPQYWSGTAGVTKRISGGEVADVVIVGAADIDQLIQEGSWSPASTWTSRNPGVGIVVREGLRSRYSPARKR